MPHVVASSGAAVVRLVQTAAGTAPREERVVSASEASDSAQHTSHAIVEAPREIW